MPKRKSPPTPSPSPSEPLLAVIKQPPQTTTAPAWEPPPATEWQPLWHQLKAYRAALAAPVDTIGCDRLEHAGATAKSRRFQILVSLLLSSQTKDEVTAEAVRQLHRRIGDPTGEGLTVDAVLRADPTELHACIQKVGFHRKKVAYLREVARLLRERYDGDIPSTVEELLQLPGIGPKMAYLAMQTAWKRNEGIGVDTHVHRISSRFHWVAPGTEKRGPEATRLALESWLPREFWPELNPLLVGLGQTICLPRNPLCHQCALSDVCPSSSHRGRRKSSA